jgi:hypothetical protein
MKQRKCVGVAREKTMWQQGCGNKKPCTWQEKRMGVAMINMCVAGKHMSVAIRNMHVAG